MNYSDDKLSSDYIFSKMAEEFTKINPLAQEPEFSATEQEIKEKIKELIILLSLNEKYLIYINNYLNKNSKYKVTAQKLGLEDAIEKTKKHKNNLISLKLISQNEDELENIRPRNIKTAIFNCCSNNADILRTFLWLMLIKNIFIDTKEVNKMAFEQSEILQSMFKLY